MIAEPAPTLSDPPPAGAPAVTDSGWRKLRRLTQAFALAALALLWLLLAGARWPAVAWLAELRRSGMAALALATLLIALAGLVAALRLSGSRLRAARGNGAPMRIGRAARWPQAFAVAPLAVLAGLIAWTCLMTLAAAATPPAADLCFLLGGAALVLAFPLLIAERVVAALPPTALPEAESLRALLFVPVLGWTLLGLLQIAAGLGLPFTNRLARWLALAVLLLAAELAVRAILRLFLPPPPAEAARAAVDSTLARLLVAGSRLRGNLADPIRTHLGIDFARSWALAYVRAALPAMALLLLLLAWGLSGIVLVGTDRRAVYERFGAPVRVLGPGAHLLLPWPLGQPRWLDFGTLHATTLGGTDFAAAPVPAEAVPPASADRLWEGTHPAEVLLLIASTRAGGSAQQAFQAVSLDLRVLWRVGLSDAQALRAAYSTSDPDGLVRATAGRAVAAFFAGQTLEHVLGENREAMADTLRQRMQDRLDGFASGLEVVAVVIEAIHPPAGAADAYHAVQAAEIAANASISAERGRAHSAAAAAAETARDATNSATAAAAETLGGARADLARFTADRDAAQVGGTSFALERYFAALTASLAHVPLTILDHRAAAGDAPVMDIRPPSAAPQSMPGAE